MCTAAARALKILTSETGVSDIRHQQRIFSLPSLGISRYALAPFSEAAPASGALGVRGTSFAFLCLSGGGGSLRRGHRVGLSSVSGGNQWFLRRM